VPPVQAAREAKTASKHAVITFAPPTHRRLLPSWIIHLGVPGLFAISAIDASIIPLAIPGSTDLLLLWFVSHRGNPWLLTSSAVAGSVVGGYITWGIGKKGGEAALERWVPAKTLKRVVGWVKAHPILAVFIPPILPPPIPLAPFLLASGALGVSRRAFVLAFGGARVLRYSLVAWLAVHYGRRIVRLWSGTLQKWSAPIMWTFAIVVVAGLIFSIIKRRSNSGGSKSGQSAAGKSADQGVERAES
jgi:membrane protein YqaA with SNARE-associated domain